MSQGLYTIKDIEASEVSHDDDEVMVGGVNQEQAEAIAKRETRVVACLRLVVLIVLVVSTVFIAFVVHSYLADAEDEEFKASFESNANKVLRSIGITLDQTLGAVDAFAVSMISYAAHNNQTWPHVTIPDFAVRSTKARRLAKSAVMALYTLVHRDERANWEAYTVANNGWVRESINLQEADPGFNGPIIFDYNTTDHIYGGWGDPVPEADFYLPTWQSSPVIPVWAPYNWDGLSVVDNEDYTTVMERKKVVVTRGWNIPPKDTTDEALMDEYVSNLDWIKDFVDPGDDHAEPIFDIFYPLLDTLDAISIEDPSREKMVGLIVFNIYWSKMLENILPASSRGVIVVIFNDCTKRNVSFQINGETVVYLGSEDYHNPQYDDAGLSRLLLDLSDLTKGDTSYWGLPVDRDYCPTTLHIYPSEIYENDFKSNDPVLFSILVAGIFVFVSLVFICYDQGVEMRQRRVMSQANQSSAIVASLFPKAVRERLYQEATETKNREAKRNNGFPGIHTFALPESSPLGEDSAVKGRPIADLFPETTIFFADLVGFTQWSVNRSPEEVFLLLETIYGAFDKIADRRRVFKIETIGDCYMAATGLPQPQKDHAVRMVRFARDCIYKLGMVLSELVDELGEDTVQLRMRVGLNSGNATGGVLRGKKSRFQLFGDTVNTASRMESTGMAGLIQISQACADALTAQGKGAWFVPRQGKIQAKGIGLVQTYWVQADDARTCTTRHGASDALDALDEHGLADDDDDNNYNSHNNSDGDGPVLPQGRLLEDQLHGYLRKSSLGGSISHSTATP